MVPPHSKQILNDAVHVQETLSVVTRLEASHLALPLSCGLVRGFDTIVGVSVRIVGDRGHDIPMRRTPVPPGLHQDIDQVTS